MNFLDQQIELECRVFRTSLHDKKAVENISEVLDQLPGIREWSVDLDDCDKVLRVVCTGLSAKAIMRALRGEGVDIQPLPV